MIMVRAIVLVLILGATSGPSLAQPPVVEKNVLYLPGGSNDQTLDLYQPVARNFPTVIFIHGGSLQQSGERRTSPAYQGVCPPLAAAGLACANIDYRLAPTNKWPAMPNDVAAAVKWVKSNIRARGGDPNRIILFGHSSGCHLATILGANPKYLARVGLRPLDIAGIVAMGCILAPLEELTARYSHEQLRQRWPRSDKVLTYRTFEDWQDSDPSKFIGPHMPPLLVVVAEAERFMPPILEQGAKIVRRLLEMDRPANLVLVPGKHMTSIARFGAQGDPTFAAVKVFVEDPIAVAPK